MMNDTQKTIKDIIPPHVLYLMWKKDGGQKRYKIGELYHDRFVYGNAGCDIEEAKEKGFQGFPAFSIEQPEHRDPLPVFMSRCPPKDRVDYSAYLEEFALPDDQPINDFTLLGYTGAYLPKNPFHLLNPFKNAKPPFQFTMQVAGFKHYQDEPSHETYDNLIGKELAIKPEPTNPYDEHAIKLILDGKDFGYIQRHLNISFKEWLDEGWNVKVSVRRINGSIEYPYAYGFVEVSEKA